MNDSPRTALEHKEHTPPLEKKGFSLLQKGLSLSVLTFFSRILGLIREMTKAKFLGTSSYSDAFGIAFMIPNLCRRLFAENSISVAFIPTFKTYLEKEKDEETTQEFVSATFTLVTFLTSIFVCLGIVFTPLILRIFFKTEDKSAMAEAVILTRIMFPYLFVISVAAFFQGILNGLKIFAPSGFTPILFNAIVILFTYALSGKTQNPARAMAIGVITGGTVQALFQLPFVLKHKWRITWTSLQKAFSNPGTKKVIALVLPTIVGMAAYQLNDIVSSALATRAGEGIYSSLNYSLRVQELILGICAVTIGTVILPDLTGFAAQNRWADFSSMLTQSMHIMALIALPITFFAFLCAEEIITLLFASGLFDQKSVFMTVSVFRCHIIGLFFIAINRIMSPAFYAQQDTKSPTIAGLLNFAANISLALLLVHQFEGPGIAIALTIASFVNTVSLFFFLRKNKHISVTKITLQTVLYALKIALFSLVALLPVFFLRQPVVDLFAGHRRLISKGVPLFLLALLFAAVGIALLAISRDQLLKTIAHTVRRKIKK